MALKNLDDFSPFSYIHPILILILILILIQLPLKVSLLFENKTKTKHINFKEDHQLGMM